MQEEPLEAQTYTLKRRSHASRFLILGVSKLRLNRTGKASPQVPLLIWQEAFLVLTKYAF